jgi:hypothetical protein
MEPEDAEQGNAAKRISSDEPTIKPSLVAIMGSSARDQSNSIYHGVPNQLQSLRFFKIIYENIVKRLLWPTMNCAL